MEKEVILFRARIKNECSRNSDSLTETQYRHTSFLAAQARALRNFFEVSRARHLIAPAGFFRRAESDSSLVIWEQVEAGATHRAEPERAGDAPT